MLRIVAPNRTRVRQIFSKSPNMWITNRMIYLNREAAEMIGAPEWMRFGIDVDREEISVWPSHQGDEYAYHAQTVKECVNGRRVENTDLVYSLLSMGLPIKKLYHHFSCDRVMGGMYLVAHWGLSTEEKMALKARAGEYLPKVDRKAQMRETEG